MQPQFTSFLPKKHTSKSTKKRPILDKNTGFWPKQETNRLLSCGVSKTQIQMIFNNANTINIILAKKTHTPEGNVKRPMKRH